MRLPAVRRLCPLNAGAAMTQIFINPAVVLTLGFAFLLFSLIALLAIL
jgi:hypothetical protein